VGLCLRASHDESIESVSNAFDRAYESLKAQIRSGAFAAGQHLDLVQLATALGVSTSPVREALSALTGERMVQSIKGVGFHVPAFDYAAVADLIKWSEYLSIMCVRTSRSDVPDIEFGVQADHIARTEHLFLSIGRLARNQEMTAALANAALRLHQLHRLEPDFLADAADEVRRLEKAVEQRSSALPHLLHAYHRRRTLALPKIARQVRLSVR